MQLMATAPRLYVIILNWNRPHDTVQCLTAVTQSTYPHLVPVVVDNGSTPGTLHHIRQAWPHIALLENGVNLGYAEGNNVGIRYALARQARYIVLLNNDALVQPDTFNQLIEAVAADPSVGAAGCKIPLFETPERLWAAGEAFPRAEPYPVDDGRFDTPRELDYAVGCCLLVRQEAILDVGLLDASFFAVHEELEWCYRLRQAGYRILYVPTAVVYHKVATSFTSNRSPAYHYLYTRNQLRLWQQRGLIPHNWRKLRGAFYLWRHEVNMLGKLGQQKWPYLLAVSWGAADFVRNRSGPPPAYLQR
jgi:GT2 family glycosyltransferase